MGRHPQVQGPQPAVDEEAVERSRHRADRVLDEAQALVELAVAGDDHAADHVGVAAEVLGRRVHDDIGARLQRPLVDRSGERVVDRDQGAAAPATTPSMSTTLSAGLVGLSTQISCVSSVDRALQGGEVGLVDEVVAQTPRRQHLVDQAVGAAVQVGRAARCASRPSRRR